MADVSTPLGLTVIAGLATYGVLGYVLGVITRADVDSFSAADSTLLEPPPV